MRSRVGEKKPQVGRSLGAYVEGLSVGAVGAITRGGTGYISIGGYLGARDLGWGFVGGRSMGWGLVAIEGSLWCIAYRWVWGLHCAGNWGLPRPEALVAKG